MRILIAEDSVFYRRLLAGTLTEWGYEVVTAGHGSAAWEILQGENAPKIAILDWMMPEMDGLEVCRRVRAMRSPEPTYLIVLTAREGKENIVKALQGGADDYITKPFDREELRARLQVGLRIVGLQTSQAVAFAFARAVEAKSPYTQGHSERVLEYSLALGEYLGLSRAEMEVLRQGALLHDIGKIGIPDSILDKAGPLTAEEFEIIKRHPTQGAQIVAPMQSISDVIPLIRWHHERRDGRGYPDGLKGNEIPPLVRLLSVADVYDALSSARPYRDSIPHARCVEMLWENAANGGLDPLFVDAFSQAVPDSLPLPQTPRKTCHPLLGHVDAEEIAALA